LTEKLLGYQINITFLADALFIINDES